MGFPKQGHQNVDAVRWWRVKHHGNSHATYIAGTLAITPTCLAGGDLAWDGIDEIALGGTSFRVPAGVEFGL